METLKSKITNLLQSGQPSSISLGLSLIRSQKVDYPLAGYRKLATWINSWYGKGPSSRTKIGGPHIKHAIHDIVNLKSLKFSRVGEIPPEIGLCCRLERLDIRGGYLCTPSTGPSKLPEEISHCKKLRVLIIYNSRLTTLPDSLFDLPLEVLTLDGCEYIERLPASIGRCKKLVNLCVSKCALKIIPVEQLVKIKTLEQTIFSQTDVSVLHVSLFQLPNLKWVDVRNTKIKYRLPAREHPGTNVRY